MSVVDDDPNVPSVSEPAPDAHHGRGLVLVQRLAQRWGVHALDGRKVVWFEAPWCRALGAADGVTPTAAPARAATR